MNITYEKPHETNLTSAIAVLLEKVLSILFIFSKCHQIIKSWGWKEKLIQEIKTLKVFIYFLVTLQQLSS